MIELILCHGEPGEFPEAQFAHDKNGQLHQPMIHLTGCPHYVHGGGVLPCHDSGDPVPPAFTSSSLLTDLEDVLDATSFQKLRAALK